MKKKNIPNALSVFRMCLVPVFAVLFFWEYPAHLWYAIAVFFLAGATDVLDGHLARKNGWFSELGKVLDPLADKLMQCTALFCFYVKDIIPFWLLLIYVLKELAIIAGALFIFRRESIVVKSGFWGKFAVCVFYAGIAALAYIHYFDMTDVVSVGVVSGIMISFAAVALIQYSREYIHSQKHKD